VAVSYSPSSKTMHHVKLLSAGSCGLVVGLSFEKLRQNFILRKQNGQDGDDYLLRQSLPGLPIFATVSAATPMTTLATVEVPEKEIGKQTSVPAALPGATRVAEIMRYGFPSLSNVRTRK